MAGTPERTKLVEQVAALTRPEMDELSFRLGVGAEYLPGPGAEPVRVALAIVRIYEQQVDGLAKLAAALEEQSSRRYADRRGYVSWVKARAATYTAFGIERPLSIETAWIPLQVREAERHDRAIAEDTRTWWRRPREWDRLASPDWRDQGYDARNVADYSMRNIVYAGPGLGKSMLLRRIAYDRSRADQLVLWVRLPRIADVLARQGTFEAALGEVAADGSGLSLSDVLRLGTPAILLADGLDECGGRMAQIAAHLRDWAMGHPTIPIVVTTRPAGYSSSLFPEWMHVELLPLDPLDVVEHATHILRAGGVEEAIARAQALSFCDGLSGHRIASMASRSPLLLRFLASQFPRRRRHWSNKGRGALRHLDRLLRLEEDAIRPIARTLLRLLESKDPELRAGVIDTLLRGLLPRGEAIQVAKITVDDSDHQVRSLAVDVLRQLTARQFPE